MNLLEVEDALVASGGCLGEGETRAELLNSVASQMIEAYLGAPLHYRVGVVEYVQGFGTNRVALKNVPIHRITSIAYLDQPVDLAVLDTDPEELKAGVIKRKGVWSSSHGRAYTIGQLPVHGQYGARYEITVDCGYLLPGQAVAPGIPTLPPILSFAAQQLVGFLSAQNGAAANASSESLLSYSITYKAQNNNETGGIPASIAGILSAFKPMIII